jgi:hypothetical protein
MYRLFLHRLLIHLLGLAGLLGCGLSLLGLGFLLYARLKFVLRGGPGAPALETPEGALFILDAFKEAGIPFLLSTIVFVLCEMALRSTHSRNPRANPPHTHDRLAQRHRDETDPWHAERHDEGRGR